LNTLHALISKNWGWVIRDLPFRKQPFILIIVPDRCVATLTRDP